jgi:hypothetical protein
MGDGELPSVIAITATCGRKTLMERSLGMFLAQDYKGEHTQFIFNNSEVPQELADLGELPYNKHVILVNNYKKFNTNERYKNLGEIYNDILSILPTCDLVYHMDDDDLFLEDHITQGVYGYIQAKISNMYTALHTYKAYKPAKSWYRHPNGIELMSNNLEPSIFVEREWLRLHGYKNTTSDQHYGWYEPLLQANGLFCPEWGKPTLIYNWGDTFPTFKTSGNSGDPRNFDNYRNFSKDHGNGILTPLPRKEVDKYYNLIKEKKAEA